MQYVIHSHFHNNIVYGEYTVVHLFLDLFLCLCGGMDHTLLK